jgi:alkylated DNA nucleotide flippase Atl1
MSFWSRLTQRRALRRKARRFVRTLHAEPGESDVAWLASIDPGGDEDHATWELRYARLALGVLAAERDALDDSVPAAVAHAVTESLSSDRRIAAAMLPLAERQFASRLATYRDAAARKHAGDPLDQRLGRTLLDFASHAEVPDQRTVDRAGQIAQGYMRGASAALLELFGRASLPEDVRPSEAYQAF